MKIVNIFCIAAMVAIMVGCGNNNSTPTAQEPQKPVVYMTKDISPEGLVKVYKALGVQPEGRVAVKISTGEPGGKNFLQPSLIQLFVNEVNGTLVECNTAYPGGRMTSEAHWKTAKDHGFLDIAPFDLLDDTAEIKIPVQDTTHIKYNIVGKNIENYDEKELLVSTVKEKFVEEKIEMLEVEKEIVKSVKNEYFQKLYKLVAIEVCGVTLILMNDNNFGKIMMLPTIVLGLPLLDVTYNYFIKYKDIKLLTQYANSFTDAAKGKAIAQNMIKDNADIVFTAGGGVNNGAWEACEEANIKAIGVDMPSNQFAPNTIITSALKNVGTGVELTVKDLVEGNFKGGEVKMFDLSNGGVGYEVTGHLPKEVIDFVESKINSK